MGSYGNAGIADVLSWTKHILIKRKLTPCHEEFCPENFISSVCSTQSCSSQLFRTAQTAVVRESCIPRLTFFSCPEKAVYHACSWGFTESKKHTLNIIWTKLMQLWLHHIPITCLLLIKKLRVAYGKKTKVYIFKSREDHRENSQTEGKRKTKAYIAEFGGLQ